MVSNKHSPIEVRTSCLMVLTPRGPHERFIVTQHTYFELFPVAFLAGGFPLKKGLSPADLNTKNTLVNRLGKSFEKNYDIKNIIMIIGLCPIPLPGDKN